MEKNLLRHQAFTLEAYKKQGGAVILVTLMMVLLLTVIGISAIKSSSLQELMAGNMRDRNLGFQAAEYALRFGETRLESSATRPVFDCSDVFCDEKKAQDAIIYWSAADWSTNAGEITETLIQVNAKPRYIIEQLPIVHGENAGLEGSGIDIGSLSVTGDADPFRITARGTGMTDTTEVVLQTTFLRKF